MPGAGVSGLHSGHVIGLDIGGTKCAVVLGRSEGDDLAVIDRLAFPTETGRGPAYAQGRIFETIREMLAKYHLGGEDLRGIGVSCGGPLDSKRGLILSPPNLPGWDQVPFVDMLQREFGVPARLQNDANACALAEWKYGAGMGTRNMIFCTCGTGFGAGLILDGRLYVGANDMAGEIGHVRLAIQGPVGYGKKGSAEGFCSGGGIAQTARAYVLEQWQQGKKVAFCREQAELNELSAFKIGEAAQKGDQAAVEILAETGRWLGRALAVLVDILNPEMVVIGGIYARQTGLIRPEAERVLAEEALLCNREVCRIVPAALGERIGDYACMVVALWTGA